jgi:hypothetical protein
VSARPPSLVEAALAAGYGQRRLLPDERKNRRRHLRLVKSAPPRTSPLAGVRGVTGFPRWLSLGEP